MKAVEAVSRDKRLSTRFSKTFVVVVDSELYGETRGVARDISAGGILVEMSYAPPLGTVVTVHFQHVYNDGFVDEIVARAEVRHHHYLNFADGSELATSRAIGLRFLEFIDLGEVVVAERLH